MRVGIILLLILLFVFFLSFLHNLSGWVYMKYYRESKNKYKTELSPKTIFLLLITIFLLLFSIISPYFFTRDFILKNFSPEKTGYIGDTLGGITNPFINMAAVIVTGLAFYMQYKANKLQVQMFEKQIKDTKKQFKKEQKNQKNESKFQQFESQFYEMLNLHKENVNEVEYVYSNHQGLEVFRGRKAFEKLNDEIKIIFREVNIVYLLDDWSNERKMNIAYNIFFFGLASRDNGLFSDYYNKIFTSYQTEAIFKRLFLYYRDSFGSGHSTYLAHLYRHLYLIAKLVLENESLTYEQQRKYFRILRAQLSNPEQVLLFYNWRSGFGDKWEEVDNNNRNGNKFFTDYRMIHNLYNEILIDNFKLENIQEFQRDFKKEKNRDNDPLFEFED